MTLSQNIHSCLYRVPLTLEVLASVVRRADDHVDVSLSDILTRNLAEHPPEYLVSAKRNLKLVEMLLDQIRSFREGDWYLHLDAIR